MSLIQELQQWWYVDRRRDKAKLILKKAERELAAVVAEHDVVLQLHNQAKTFKFAEDLVRLTGQRARLKKLIEQTTKFLTDV